VCIFHVNSINLALTTAHGKQTSILQTKKARRSSVRMRHIAQIGWSVDQLGSGVVQLRVGCGEAQLGCERLS
jgi:hypothetical protein